MEIAIDREERSGVDAVEPSVAYKTHRGYRAVGNSFELIEKGDCVYLTLHQACATKVRSVNVKAFERAKIIW